MKKHSKKHRNPERVLGVSTPTPYREKHVSSKGTKKNAPAKKRRIPEVCSLPGLSTIQLPHEYHGILFMQGDARSQSWTNEAVRLLEEYIRTGREIHLVAHERLMRVILVYRGIKR